MILSSYVNNVPWAHQREAMLELTWNWGTGMLLKSPDIATDRICTEKDATYKYCNGNVPTPAEGRGFGHIGFSVSDVGVPGSRSSESDTDLCCRCMRRVRDWKRWE